MHSSVHVSGARVMCHVTLEVIVTLRDETGRVYVITLGYSGHSAVDFDLMNSCFLKNI